MRGGGDWRFQWLAQKRGRGWGPEAGLKGGGGVKEKRGGDKRWGGWGEVYIEEKMIVGKGGEEAGGKEERIADRTVASKNMVRNTDSSADFGGFPSNIYALHPPKFPHPDTLTRHTHIRTVIAPIPASRHYPAPSQ